MNTHLNSTDSFTVNDWTSPRPGSDELVDITVTNEGEQIGTPTTFQCLPVTTVPPTKAIPERIEATRTPHHPPKPLVVRSSITQASSSQYVSLLTRETKQRLSVNPREITYIICSPSNSSHVSEPDPHNVINPGKDPAAFCHSFKDIAGKYIEPQTLNDYFKRFSKDQVKAAKERFLRGITCPKQRTLYKQTIQALRRKYDNKISASRSRANKREINTQQLEALARVNEELAGANNTIAQARTLEDALKKSLPVDLLKDNQPAQNILSSLTTVLESSPAETP